MSAALGGAMPGGGGLSAGARIRAESALWLANRDTAFAAVKVEDCAEAVEHIDAAIEALEQARRAIRGW